MRRLTFIEAVIGGFVVFICGVLVAQNRLPQLIVDNLTLDGSTLSSNNTNGDIILNPDGSGGVQLPDQTASRAIYLDANQEIVSDANVSNTELGFLDGVLSTLCGITDTCTMTNKTLTSPTINTPTVDVPLFDDQTTPSNPSAGFYKVYVKNDGNMYILNSAGTEQQFTLGATSKVFAFYESNAGQNITNNSVTIVDFEDSVRDSDSAVTTGASWKFEPPRTGDYVICAKVKMSTTTGWAADEFYSLFVYVDGSEHQEIYFWEFGNAQGVSIEVGGNGCAFLGNVGTANDVDVRIRHSQGSTKALSSNAEDVYVMVYSID